MDGPSAHLLWEELDCRDGSPYPIAWRVDRAPTLAHEFEAIRAALGGKPIRINSAYRTEQYNRRIGGSRNSQHVQGRALDLSPIHCTLDELKEACLARARTVSSAINGVGFYPSFVHIDIRPSDRLVRWQGTRAWAEMKA